MLIRLYLSFIIIALVMSCTNREKEKAVSTYIQDNWAFRKQGDSSWIPAVVPGCVHTDLLAQKIIEDPFFGTNEDSIQWIERENWEYKCSFSVTQDMLERPLQKMVFEGLDTYADIYVNDSLLASYDNMFVGHELDVKDRLKEGENELRVLFNSPVNLGMDKLRSLDYILPVTNEQAPRGEQSNVFTRKAPFQYGWDWGPRLVTSGIWRPVKLLTYHARIEDVYLRNTVFSEEECTYEAILEIESSKTGVFFLEVYLNGDKVQEKQLNVEAGTDQYETNISITKPEFWWSNGLGDPYQYDVSFVLRKSDHTYDTETQKLGVRKIELVQEPDSAGRTFYFRLNGVPVFAKGANYIPSEVFVSKQSTETYKRVIKDALQANMNMLRVWGGAIYENDEFYDLCDANGIMVWQDFMFACAAVPIDSAYQNNVKREAEYNVKRLRNHPSLVLWCGNNENSHGWAHWGWKDNFTPDQLEEVFSGNERLFRELLPSVVAALNPETSYWPTSPQSYGGKLSDRKSGDEHDWLVWFQDKPFENYFNELPRFVSEYGVQSFAELNTIKSFCDDTTQLYYKSELMDRRQRGKVWHLGEGMNGNDLILRYIEKYYQSPKDFESLLYLSQLMQAKGLSTAIEAHRSNMPHTMGSLYWQINDCWPTTSWSSVDYYGNWKASHYAVKRAFEPLALATKLENDKMEVRAMSDVQAVDLGHLEWQIIGFGGEVLTMGQEPFDIQANSSVKITDITLPDSLLNKKNSSFLLLTLLEDDSLLAEKVVFFAPERMLELVEPSIKVETRNHTEGVEINLRSDKFVKGLRLEVEQKGRFSDNYFDLIPGQVKRVFFESKDDFEGSIDLSLFHLYDTRISEKSDKNS